VAAPSLSRHLASLAILGALFGCARTSRPAVGVTPSPPVSLRAVRTANGSTLSIDDIAAQAMHVEFVFFGEQHNDPETHFAELAFLDALGRRGANVVVSLEMFERDVQPMLDDYLAGTMTEADFLAKARPWPNYATDYRPLVVLARARGWPVIASNVPRPIASAVSRNGLAALDSLPPEERNWVARDIKCPHDAYYDLFAEQMKEHGGPGSASDTASMRAITDRYYEAQCVKDETMAESIISARARGGSPIVVHFNGAFHSDYSFGTASRVMRRTGSGHIVISAIPVADPTAPFPDEYDTRGHFVILTRQPPGK
jgi:uncharacterized iron-regulated protein